MSTKWKDFWISHPKKQGWRNCPKCNGSGCNPNRTNVCWCCRGEGGFYGKSKDGADAVLITADSEVFPVESIFKSETKKKDELKYAKQQYRFRKSHI